MNATLELRRIVHPPFALLTELARDDARMFSGKGLRDIDFSVVVRAGAVFDALSDGVRAGSCQLLRMWDDPAAAWVIGFYVLPEHQGRGFGRAFLEALAAEAGRAGLRRLLLSVDAGNIRAIDLYRSFGFTRVDTVLDFYGPSEDREVLLYEIPEARREILGPRHEIPRSSR